MTDILDELQRLEAEATPGKWLVTVLHRLGTCVVFDRKDDDGRVVAERLDDVDAALIAAARNALPALVEVARAAREVDEISAGRTRLSQPVTAPWHRHAVPGIWDDDNGERAGKPCADCAAFVALRAALARLDGGA